MFIAALFTIARTWKQPKCPSTDEWIKTIYIHTHIYIQWNIYTVEWHIYTMEYYSAIKRNEIGSFVEMLMDLESVIWSEVSQKEREKQISYINAYMWNLEKRYR